MHFPQSTLRHWIQKLVGKPAAGIVSITDVEQRMATQRQRLLSTLEKPSAPRIALVKQDVCEDLYCASSDSSPRALLESTQLRSGPVALLMKTKACFHILETNAAPECQIWQERAIDLRWDTLDFFASYRDQIPGCDYGQKRFAVNPRAVDWSQYDIVISVDVAVPADITRQFPRTAWAYYVREIKAPSYNRGLTAPAAGQDLFLSHGFRWNPPAAAAHVVEFPYHLQFSGCFHELFQLPFDAPREGTFVDHHTLVMMSLPDRERLAMFGPVAGPVLPTHLRYEGGKSVPPRRTMDPDLRERLLASKYFLITPGERNVFGTALVESIAAGCLAIGSPTALSTHGFIFSPRTSADSLDKAFEKIRDLENDPAAYHSELQRQRLLIDWLCYVRPLQALFDKAADVVARRQRI